MKPMGIWAATRLTGTLTLFGTGLVLQAATGTIQDVQHVVILMQENRSFDHYFGTLRGVRGFGDGNALVFTNGNSVFYQPFGLSYVLPIYTNSPCLSCFSTSWSECHGKWNGGKWDQWIPVGYIYPMPYYRRTDLEFYYALAEAYTVCDAYHCSVMGPTLPNRYYLMTGMIDPTGIAGGPAISNVAPAGGFSWTTYPERLEASGISWKVYQQSSDMYGLNALSWFAQYKNAQPGNPLYDRGMALVSNVVDAVRSDVTNGTLPRVSWIIPPFSDSEHPCFAPSSGELFTRQIIEACVSNPSVWNSTVFFLNYDEGGGFFDHVPPPTPRPGTADEFVNGEPVGLGVRVPMIVVSPWSRGGYVCSQVFDHTSVIRFLERWTGVAEPNISSWRRALCGDLTSAFDFTQANTNTVILPAVISEICTNCVNPSVPSLQVFPLQESGARPARPLPYQPNAFAAADCVMGQLSIIMTNSGTESVHFAIYPNAYRADGPWQYDVPAGTSEFGSFTVFTNGAGPYDFTCYGPNGFNRRFAGHLSSNYSEVEVTSTIDLLAGGLRIRMQNLTAGTVMFTLTNAMEMGQSFYIVPAGAEDSAFFGAVTRNKGWYDISAGVQNDGTFLRRFAGHIEGPEPVTALAVSCSQTNIILTYPASLTNTLQYAPSIVPTNWKAVAATPEYVGSNAVVRLPIAGREMFFRLSP